jgi:hypothetical protein
LFAIADEPRLEVMMEADSHSGSQLFTLRLWIEGLDATTREWRGTVKHVVTRDTLHFRDWHTLQAFLLERLRDTPVDVNEAMTNIPSEGDRA